MKIMYQKEIVPEINNTEEITEGTFPINVKFIQKYQRAEPSLMAKYEDGTYHKGSFHGGSNKDLRLTTCKDKIIILSKSKVMYYIGSIRIYFIQEWIEQRQRFARICTGPALDMPSGSK